MDEKPEKYETLGKDKKYGEIPDDLEERKLPLLDVSKQEE